MPRGLQKLAHQREALILVGPGGRSKGLHIAA